MQGCSALHCCFGEEDEDAGLATLKQGAAQAPWLGPRGHEGSTAALKRTTGSVAAYALWR